MLRKRVVLDKYFKSYTSLLLLTIVSAVILHVSWQIISIKVGTDNRVIADITNRFGLDQELSFPTWVSSMMALLVATLAWIIGKNQSAPMRRLTWYTIAIFGLMVSVDEVAAFHELLLQSLHILANFGEGQGLLANAWLIVAPMIIVFLIFGIRLLYRNLPHDTSKRLMVALLIYLSGAFIIEYASIPIDKSSGFYSLGMVVVEESLELLGMFLAIRAILVHITKHEKLLRKKLADIIA